MFRIQNKSVLRKNIVFGIFIVECIATLWIILCNRTTSVNGFFSNLRPQNIIWVRTWIRGRVLGVHIGFMDEAKGIGLGVDFFTGKSSFESCFGTGGTATHNGCNADGNE